MSLSKFQAFSMVYFQVVWEPCHVAEDEHGIQQKQIHINQASQGTFELGW